MVKTQAMRVQFKLRAMSWRPSTDERLIEISEKLEAGAVVSRPCL
jgi:hypothetical protein